jgi:CheY-like chemotaxis protein
MAKKVLVVDDYEDSRSMLVRFLEALGYQTVEAASGAEAVQKALSEKLNIIVMDLGLPDITGIDAARELKQHPTTAHLPIIAYSAWPSRQFKARALQSGMVVFLVKPVSPRVIQEAIEKYILP